jgi:hypothetical protein
MRFSHACQRLRKQTRLDYFQARVLSASGSRTVVSPHKGNGRREIAAPGLSFSLLHEHPQLIALFFRL